MAASEEPSEEAAVLEGEQSQCFPVAELLSVASSPWPVRNTFTNKGIADVRQNPCPLRNYKSSVQLHDGDPEGYSHTLYLE